MGRDHGRLGALISAAVLAGAGCAGQSGGPPGHDPGPFLADLAQLERFVGTTYAHLEWAVTEGEIDPVAVRRAASEAIRVSRSPEQALAALHGFVDGFADGHFRLQAPGERSGQPAGGRAAAGPGPGATAAQACEALGYERHDKSFRIDFGESFQPITGEGDPLPAGHLGLAEGRVGILRIDEFGANRYDEYCPAAWEAYRRRLAAPCLDPRCRRRFRLTVEERLLDELGARVERLREAGVAALVVDITGNGGGSDWNDPAARLLTRRHLRGNDVSFVRHPHWRGILAEMRAEVGADLERSDLGPDRRRLLEELRERLEAGIAATRQRCDLSTVWTRGADELPCSLLVRGVLFTTGLLRRPPEVDVSDLEIGPSLFLPLRWRPRPPVWDGPLAVLIDHDTGSAAAAFAALLQDNGAATLIGERTDLGTGCGYTNGGIREVLANSGLEVLVSDCVRHRRAGGSERAGIDPDLAVSWRRGDSPRALGESLLARLADWDLGVPAARDLGDRERADRRLPVAARGRREAAGSGAQQREGVLGLLPLRHQGLDLVGEPRPLGLQAVELPPRVPVVGGRVGEPLVDLP